MTRFQNEDCESLWSIGVLFWMMRRKRKGKQTACNEGLKGKLQRGSSGGSYVIGLRR